MKKIHGFNECLQYVVHLGMTPKGTINYREHVLCCICDRLMQAGGNSSWYHKTFKPFYVRFNRKNQQFLVQSNKTQSLINLKWIKY